MTWLLGSVPRTFYFVSLRRTNVLDISITQFTHIEFASEKVLAPNASPSWLAV